MDRENVKYVDNGAFYSLSRGGNPAICGNMDDCGDIMLSETSQTQTKTVGSHVHVESGSD